MTLDTQFMTMIFMIVGGFYLGIARDTFRRFSPYWKKKTWLTYVLESSFWLTQTFLLFYVLFKVNGGELRVYVFLACLLGYSMYKVMAANLYQKALEKIISMLRAICRFFARTVQALLITPLRWIVRMVITLFLTLMQLILSIIFFLFKVIYTPIKWIFQLIYRLLPKKMQKILHKTAGFYSIIKNIYIKLEKYIPFKRR
ncbi:spore cortex biosynthesis protein YabQ [Virgibacillus alimentarius]|uniref:Spore cortex biosynthesis protein YabQ n=1 Tax=Virgibacillus alimentarius TaxID=698769 RepID=A0ABS4S6P2_9BACI|nr:MULTISPECIES: spore cortex biosynthesis protein YabQ [Virgibacillus]MBP2257138.1 spore cortex biosynthesis protein YabQ [Virgibacillus alimentarius]HLR66653.1 spore cortex biosynthesis protein YabQ [Virgibacillus sp.]